MAACGQSTDTGSQSSGGESSGDSAKPIVLKYASGLNMNHPHSIEGDQFFIKRAEELSNGKLKFEFYPEAQLGEISDASSTIGTGVADISLIIPSYESGKMPMSNAFTLPFMTPNGDVATKAFWEFINNPSSIAHEIDFKRNGIKPLYASVFPPYELVTRNKPIKSLDDLKGLKIRNPGGAQEFIVKEMGATPVHVVNAEQYIAIERGTIDGGLYELPFILSLKLDEVTNYLTTNANITVAPMLVGMNADKFNSLPKELQDVLIQAGEETNENIAEKGDEYKKESIDTFVENGLEAVELTPEQIEEIKEETQPVYDIWVEQMEGQGLPGKQALEEARAILEKY
jgi:TRAP-type C4-dicarboxylate transport system substrate-binding protein